MTGTEVHDLDSMRVGDLVLAVAPATERTTLEIVVDRDATLVLKAPRSASIERVEEFVASKRSWIYRKLAEKDALVGPPIVKQFVDGEGFAYLGRSHRLLIDDAADTVRLDRGRFLAPPAVRTGGVQLMRDWYVGTGTQWLRGRVQPWASRLGIDDLTIDVRELQLPPSHIDYILVHELSHLREANHTPEFWATVGSLLPGYESQKANLASIGRGVWLGNG